MTVKDYVAVSGRRAMADYYCRQCGAELLLVNRKTGVFDATTGDPIVRTRGVCPKRHGLFGLSHENDGLVSIMPDPPRPRPRPQA